MKIKQGVSLKGLSPQMALAAVIVSDCYRDRGHECEITDGRTGFGLAFGTRNIPSTELLMLVQSIKLALGDEFQAVLETTFLHVEYDPD